MQAYLDIVRRILETGIEGESRGYTSEGEEVTTTAVIGHLFEHNMANGFPLLTTKKMPFKMIASELEFFIKGLTDKRWLQERKNTIWDEWCRRDAVEYARDAETRAKMMANPDLGPVYGWQWRHFGADYTDHEADYTGQGIDQLEIVIDKLKNNPFSRNMIVSAWNPVDLPKMALDPCHYMFILSYHDGKLDLTWNQRSVDTMLGLPFNIASYAILLHLIAKETGMEEGVLRGNLQNVHIYNLEDHLEGGREQITREPKPLPRVVTDDFTSIFDWTFDQSRIEGYESHERIPMQIVT